MDAKETYRERIEATLREWKAKVDELKAKVDEIEAHAKKKYHEQTESLLAKGAQAEEKLEELKAAGEEAWENVRSGVEYGWHELRRAAESAITKFRSGGSMTREEEIRLIAYELWEEEGRPHGRHLDHWLKAEAIWEGQQGQEHFDEPAQKQTRKRKGAQAKTVRRVAKKKPRSKAENNLRTL